MTEQTLKLPPPYMTYGIFKKVVETFSDTTVPSGPLDRRVLSELSGADYGSLISGLRFLGLTDDERQATAHYRELVRLLKEPEKFKARWREIITERYKPIIGHMDLENGTSAQLEKAFKDYGVTAGQMLTKSIRFFINAETEVGTKLSPYLTAPKPRTPRVANSGKKSESTKAVVASKQNKPQDDSANQEVVPSGYERLPLPGMPNSFIQYPANLTDAQCEVLQGMVGVLRTSVKARTGGKEKT